LDAPGAVSVYREVCPVKGKESGRYSFFSLALALISPHFSLTFTANLSIEYFPCNFLVISQFRRRPVL
jgi:hypothetical protein